jgi:ubiquinone/menaquinone biosynthesis C-methylase UbiE
MSRADRAGSFDRVASIYDASRGLPAAAEAEVAATLAERFRRAAPEPRVLEVGIGTGRIALPLAGRGCRIVGVDLSPAMLAALRRKRGDAAVQTALGSAGALPFRAGAFDGGLFVHVLHLVPDAGEAIHEALRVVRSGGVLAFGGEDLWQSELLREARRLMREAIREVSGLELGGTSGHARVLSSILEELSPHAVEPVERVPLAAWESRTTGREILGQLERKDMSWMWPLPDADVPAVLERLRPGLEALCGDMDRSHAIPRSMSALVAELK